MKRARIAATVLLTILLILAVAGCGGGGALSEEELIEIAEEVVTESFPEMSDAARTTDSYTSGDREFYEVTYSTTIEVESDGEALELPRVVIVTIDKETGEQFVAVSD
jgi:hypothetical protein